MREWYRSILLCNTHCNISLGGRLPIGDLWTLILEFIGTYSVECCVLWSSTSFSCNALESNNGWIHSNGNRMETQLNIRPYVTGELEQTAQYLKLRVAIEYSNAVLKTENSGKSWLTNVQLRYHISQIGGLSGITIWWNLCQGCKFNS